MAEWAASSSGRAGAPEGSVPGMYGYGESTLFYDQAGLAYHHPPPLHHGEAPAPVLNALYHHPAWRA